MSAPGRRVGLFGGTFDPIHLGHVVVAEEVRRQLDLHEVRILPCRQPPHKDGRGLTPGADRLAMVALATQEYPALVPCSLELERPGPSYTIDTLTQIRAAEPGHELFLILGADSFLELPTWREHERLSEAAHLVVVNRPGTPDTPPPAAGARGDRVRFVSVPPQAVSSREVREHCRRGLDPTPLVGIPVADYIGKCALYRAT